jgi:hypothetical protein
MAIYDSLVWVNDYVRWGQLLKRWAKGEPGAPPIPTTREELINVCLGHGVTITIPDRITKVNIRPAIEDTLTIMLPSKVLLEGVEEGLRSEDYPIHRFYMVAWKEIPPPLLNVTYDTKMEFHAGRIGEYTISNCC